MIFRNGQEVGSTSATIFEDAGLFAGTTFAYQAAARSGSGEMSPLSAAAEATTEPFEVNDVAMGDAGVSYANVEVTDDNRFLVWFEQSTDGSGLGAMWHCAIDGATGALVPSDCKGFRAFDSTLWGRANVGIDETGVFYVGMDRSGRLILVRPTGPSTGSVAALSTPADALRRAIYPTNLADGRKFVFWIRNSDVPGGGYSPPGNASFTLQYLDLSNPAIIHDVETQPKPPIGMAPMDVGFARWFRGKASLTYGGYDANGFVQVKEFNAETPSLLPHFATDDQNHKIDPWSMAFGADDLIIAGVNGEARSVVYRRSAGGSLFNAVEEIVPSPSMLANPSLAQSHQSIEFDGRLYTAYQVNEKGAGFYETITGTGEIWLSTVLQNSPVESQWRLSGSADPAIASLAKSEPEPCVGTSKVWVFYSAVPNGSDFSTSVWTLRRADTPVGKR
ncbi:MAG: hypothetical protein ACOZAA_04290 [Pseudomonadota bacterium]